MQLQPPYGCTCFCSQALSGSHLLLYTMKTLSHEIFHQFRIVFRGLYENSVSLEYVPIRFLEDSKRYSPHPWVIAEVLCNIFFYISLSSLGSRVTDTLKSCIAFCCAVKSYMRLKVERFCFSVQ